MSHTSESVQAWLGYLFTDELRALKELARSLPSDPIVVNIGAGGGTSGLAFKESRPDLILITIDITDLSSPFGCLEGERIVLQDAGFVLGDGWHQIHGDSVEVGKRWNSYGYSDVLSSNGHSTRLWPYGPADMIFVDGGHLYEECAGDIVTWLPHVKPGGLLAVHDYRKDDVFSKPTNGAVKPHPRAWPGVDKAVDELLVGKYEVVLHVDSLIVFRVPAHAD